MNIASNNKCIYIIFFLLYINVNYSQILESKKFYFRSGELSSEGILKDGKPDGKWINYYKNSKKKSLGYWKEALLDSTWLFYDSLGTITLKEEYKNNKKHGIIINYDNIGIIVKKTFYKNGNKEGKEVMYFEGSNKILKENNYKNNMKNGICYNYDSLENIISILDYDMGIINKKEEINRLDSEGEKHGVWKFFYDNNKTKIEEIFFHGQKDGFTKVYDKKGKIEEIKNYKNGVENNIEISKGIKTSQINIKNGYMLGVLKNDKKQGLFKVFDSTGNQIKFNYFKNDTLIYDGNFDKSNYKKGSWTFYWPNGKIKEKGVFLKNNKSEEWKYYFENGVLQQKGKFLKNKPNGVWQWWYINGQIRRQEEYINGKENGLIIEYDTNGVVITKGEYFYGEREGNWEYKINDFKEKGKYIGGMKIGLWKSIYTTTNKTKFKGEFINDIPIGKHVNYYSNGLKKEEGKYKNGEKNGEWNIYNKNGELVVTYLYKNGNEFKRDGVKIK